MSVVAPVFDEVGSLGELYRRVRTVLEGAVPAWELVLVDDGSSDGSRDAIRALAEADRPDRAGAAVPQLRPPARGHPGLDHSRGQAVVIIDADLQDPPEVIPELLARWREGAAVVSAVRKDP